MDGGCSPWGHEESDTTEQLHFHFSLSCIEEGNGNPLQCSCLENARDRGTWWAAISRVAQSRTRLKQLSSSRYLQRIYLIMGKYLKYTKKKTHLTQLNIRNKYQIKAWSKDLNKFFSKEDILTANSHMKRCSSLVIRKTLVKTTVRYHLTHVRMTTGK